MSTFPPYEIEEVFSGFAMILAIEIGVPIFLVINQSTAKIYRYLNFGWASFRT